MRPEVLCAFFGWCTLINVGLLVFSFVILTALRSFVYKVHAKMFPMSEQQFNAIIYSGFMIHKILIITFNLIPYLVMCIIKE